MENGKCSSSAGTGSCGGQKQCGKMFMGALLGAIVMFAWVSFSWMVLPWHCANMNGFKDEKAVAQVLLDNMNESGMYSLPYMKDMKATPAVDKPYAFMSVVGGGVDMKNMTRNLVTEFLMAFIAAMILTCLLKKVCCSGNKICFSGKIGVLIALISYVPLWNWFHFSTNYVLVGMADVIIATTLAGAVISKTALKDSSCCGGSSSGGCGSK